LTSSTGGADSDTRMVSPMPSASSAPNATDDLMVPWNAGPASVTPEVQRVVALLGELPVGADHDDRVVVLHRDLDVAEAVLLEERALPERGLDQRLGRRPAVLLQQPLVQRAGVDADADRHARGRRRRGDLLHLVVELADVAGLTRTAAQPASIAAKTYFGWEVDVGDDRDLRLARDRRQRLDVVLAGHGDPHDLAADAVSSGDLLQRSR
jgi:hypothetical protein